MKGIKYAREASVSGLLDKEGSKLLHSVSDRADDGGTGASKPDVCDAGLSSPARCKGMDVARGLVTPLAPSTDSADRLMAQEAVIAAGIHD
jgi:hypothetical protein